jgi:hypothetical protein
MTQCYAAVLCRSAEFLPKPPLIQQNFGQKERVLQKSLPKTLWFGRDLAP